MCLICIEFQKEKMTIFEARRALTEMVRSDHLDDEHVKEVEQMLDEAEPTPEWDFYLPHGTGESD